MRGKQRNWNNKIEVYTQTKQKKTLSKFTTNIYLNPCGLKKEQAEAKTFQGLAPFTFYVCKIDCFVSYEYSYHAIFVNIELKRIICAYRNKQLMARQSNYSNNKTVISSLHHHVSLLYLYYIILSSLWNVIIVPHYFISTLNLFQELQCTIVNSNIRVIQSKS